MQGATGCVQHDACGISMESVSKTCWNQVHEPKRSIHAFIAGMGSIDQSKNGSYDCGFGYEALDESPWNSNASSIYCFPLKQS